MSSSPGPEDGIATSDKKRRSGRVSKKPQFLVGDPTGTKRKRTSTAQDAGADGVSDTSNDESESDDSEEEPDEEEFREQRAKKKSAPKRPAAKKPKTNGTSLQIPIRNTAPRSKKFKKPGGIIPDAKEAGGLYAEIFATDKVLEEVASEWTRRFTTRDAEAFAEVVNFVLKCCGSESGVTNYDVEDVDGAPNRIADLQDEYQAQIMSDYPIVAKTKFAATLKSTMCDFFSILVRTIDATGLLFATPSFMEQLQAWLGPMSSAQSRPFRHTATVIALTVMTSLTEIGRDLASTAASAQRQSDSMAKGKAANKKRASGLLRDATQAQEKQAALDNLLRSWYDTVFIHRYRDVDPKIRMECSAALGSWITTYPDEFFADSHMRYLGWMLSDPYWPARHEVATQLRRVYADKDRLSGLRAFTERFRPRMVEMAVLDNEPTIRAIMIDMANILRQAGFLEPDDVDAVGRLVFDADPRVRKSVVGFFKASVEEIYESKVEDLGGEEAISEELGDVVETPERPGLPWLHLKCLVEVLDSYDQIDPDITGQVRKGPGNKYGLQAGELESRFVLVAESLYPSMDILHHWGTLAKYLLYDTSESRTNGVPEDLGSQIREACKLSEREEFILLELLNVSIRQHVSELVEASHSKSGKKTKKQRDEITSDQESTAREITNLIPQLLKRFGGSAETVLAVLRLERIVSLDAFADFQQDPSTYKDLLNDIEKQFMTHGNEEVLDEASRALLRAKNYTDLGDVTDEKIDELWEGTLQTLRQLVGNVDVAARGTLSTKVLEAMVKTVARLERLAAISDPIAHLDASPTQLGGKAHSKGPRSENDATSSIDLLISLVRRGMLDPSVPEEALQQSYEDDIVLHAARCAAFYNLWSISQFRAALETGSVSAASVEPIASHRDALVTAITASLQSRPAADPVSHQLGCILLDLHVAGATLRSVQAPGKTDLDLVLRKMVVDVPRETSAQLLKVFGALEQRFARKTGKHIEKVVEATGRKARKTRKVREERAVDAEPMSEDELDRDPDAEDEEPADQTDSEDEEDEEEEEADREEDKETALQRREQRRLQEALLAEQRLCELTAKLVLGVLAGLVDEKLVRKRLDVNKTKLGPNFKEVLKLLDEGKKPAGKKAATAKRETQESRAADQKSKKSEPVVIDSDEEDEGDDDEEDDVDLDDALEGADRDGDAQRDEEADMEAESVLGD